MLDHIGRAGETGKLAKKMTIWHIRLFMAKGLFWVSAGVAAIVWAIKS